METPFAEYCEARGRRYARVWARPLHQLRRTSSLDRTGRHGRTGRGITDLYPGRTHVSSSCLRSAGAGCLVRQPTPLFHRGVWRGTATARATFMSLITATTECSSCRKPLRHGNYAVAAVERDPLLTSTASDFTPPQRRAGQRHCQGHTAPLGL